MNPDQQIELYRVARSIAWSYRLQDYNAAALKDLQRIVDKSKASIVQKFADGLGQEGFYTRKHFQNSLKELERLSLGLRNQLGEQLTISTSRIGSLALKEWGENLSVGGVAKKVNTVALSPEQFAAFFKRNPPAGILIPKVMRNALNQGVIGRIEGELLDVLREGALTGQSYKRIVDKLEDSFTDFNRHQLTTLTRTFFQTANAQAFDAVYQANQDIMEGKIWTNVNDDRVCILCLPLGEVLYKKGEDHPPMPRHPNCRCVFRAKTVSYRSLGVDVDELEEVAAPVVTRGYFAPVKGGPISSKMIPAPELFEGKGPLNFDAFPEDIQRQIASFEWDSTNAVLRHGADRINHSDRIDAAFASYAKPLPGPTKVWRGSKGTIIPNKVGAEFTDKGYFRFTGDKRRASDFIEKNMDVQFITVRLPDGTKALPGHHVFEKEALLPRGSKFKVVRVEKTKNGARWSASEDDLVRAYRYDVEVELILPMSSASRPGKWIIPPAGTGTGRRPRAVSFYQGGMKEAFPDLPAAQQKAMLGVGRYNLYKAGDLTLDQLVDKKTGKLWLLKELDEGMHL